jgi:hypothetical protein
MRRDLQELVISPFLVENLSGVPIAWLYRPRPIRRWKDWLRQFSPPFGICWACCWCWICSAVS